jgi:hypothetical protein
MTKKKILILYENYLFLFKRGFWSHFRIFMEKIEQQNPKMAANF